MMQIVRWGIIGCGDVTEVKSGPGFRKAQGSALAAVMRRDGDKAADYARRHGVPRWYDDADALIADADVDAVYVATPPSSHEASALRACAAGKPCYVEKPMARNAAEARRMVEAFAARGVPLFVAYYRRALPRFVKVKQILDSGKLGELRAVSYAYADGQMKRRMEPPPWRVVAEQAGGGLFLDLGSHALDLLDFFLGPLTDVSGHAENAGRQYDVEDRVSMTFAAGRVAGRAAWDFVADRAEDRFVIEGDRGRIAFACFANEPVVVETADGRAESFDVAHPAHVQQPLIQRIVDALRGAIGHEQVPSTGASGLRTQRVMDVPLEGFYGARGDGFWGRTPGRG